LIGFTETINILFASSASRTVSCGSLSPQHGAFSCCRYRRRSPDMEGRCECI